MGDIKILVTGANGQLGTEMSAALADRYGARNIITTDIMPRGQHASIQHEVLDVTDITQLQNAVRRHKITQIYHLAAALSVVAEKDARRAWELNLSGLLNVLETAALFDLERVFWPSSIAAFGPTTPADDTAQHTITEPNTVYGVSKLAGEGLCRWYFENKGVDVRSIRFPGVISSKVLPGGGTTDYAVDIFHYALRRERYICPLQANEPLPMIYMADAIRATLQLMEAAAEQITERGSYNIAGFSCTPQCIAIELQNHFADFEVIYQPALPQKIAKGWPNSINDSQARDDWNWRPAFDLPRTTREMLVNLARDWVDDISDQTSDYTKVDKLHVRTACRQPALV
ncbi:hypothetical protein HIM_02431 [Hirsutella minnesotensis 3608]|nr:hypothetical protein HIM_02431 [Hirsutella minnesotensis 3608]